MKKKIVSILLCTAMVATMAAGCGGSGDSGSDSGSDAKTEEDAGSDDAGASTGGRRNRDGPLDIPGTACRFLYRAGR